MTTKNRKEGDGFYGFLVMAEEKLGSDVFNEIITKATTKYGAPIPKEHYVEVILMFFREMKVDDVLRWKEWIR